MLNKKITLLFILSLCVSFSFGSEYNPLPNTLEYKLDLSVEYGTKMLYGQCEISILNDTEQAIENIPVLLYRLLSVKNITDDKGRVLPFNQNVVSILDWQEIQVNYIEISLNDILNPGEQIKIDISYEGYLFGYSAEGWRYVKDHIDEKFTIIRTDGFGYPMVGYPDDQYMMSVYDQYDYLINITVPDEMTAVTGGKLIEKKKTGNNIIFTYQNKKPSWRLDIAVSDYRIDQKGENRVYYFAGDSLGADKVINALQTSLDLYTQWFGPLKNNQGLTIIEVPEGYGSQQDVNAIILTADHFKAKKEMIGIYHEAAHLWNVTHLDDQPCRFESEGFAQFLQFLLLEKLDNRENAVSEAAQRFLDRVRNDFNENKEYQTVPIRDYGIRDMTDYSYTLGMAVFAIFYDLVGQDHFNHIIGSFYSENYSTGATLDEFVHHCKTLAPVDLEQFFNDWIYTTSGIKQMMKGATFKELLALYSGG
ncbi:hypothetical protein JW835_05855 [bacterium]|nr:hypothetical protein [bacterium]